MSQVDYSVANDTHANVRADLNAQLGAVATFNSGASAPSTTFANMIYANTSTTPNIYYVRNNGNSAWASLFTDTGLIRAANGAVGGPSIGWSSTTTHGLYYGSSTSWSAAVAGVNAFTLSTTLHGWNLAAGDIDFSIGATGGGANSFFVQGSDGYIGLGTGTPAFLIDAQRDAAINCVFSAAVSSTAAASLIGKKARGTNASPAATSSGDIAFRLIANVYHASGTPGYANTAEIRMLTDGAESGNTVPTAIAHYTMASGGSLTERFRISSAGLATFGLSDSSAGNVYLYGGSGTTSPTFRMYTPADEDTTVDYWEFTTDQTGGTIDSLYIGPDTDADMFSFGGSGGTVGTFSARNVVTAGVTGTQRGALQAYRGTSTNTPAYILLEARSGTEYYFWVTDAGVLRVHTAAPAADTDGSAV